MNGERSSNGNAIEPSSPASTLTNGVSELRFDDDDYAPSTDAVLSSSLEAERRLLLSMGWSEDDDNSTPITEEEIRELQQLQPHIKQVRYCRTPIVWTS